MARSVVSVLTLLALAAPAAYATQVMHMDTRALVVASNDIVVGEVESVAPRWSPSHTKIFTDVRVRVTQSLKGGGATTLTLSQLGGTIGAMRYNVPGCPAFTPGEEALLFVWRDRQGGAQVSGLAQGKFDIRRDAAGVATVQRSAEGLAVLDANRLQLVPPGRPAPRIPLADLVRAIQSAMREGAGR
ncbi:MAG: hypothetical protein HY076_01015 [Candidatus Eisenbacteria bacterium]|uniref:Uncharacterized protein n=1 Tax=Eiseniibacteriota bacterium TaxID=2212470 RepID=A0A9D6L4W1_UNCEI|nr:hypothetical protein [Candidatus Eisenbacteria bacterium]MBI3538841.1 hypothetical protein [Candidatus Eisenbacteria bacterium]